MSYSGSESEEEPEPQLKKLKLVLVGDKAVGKSSLITSYLHNKFSADYEPNKLAFYKGKKKVMNEQLDIEIQDMSGDKHLGFESRVQYKDVDCFMICVASNQKSSL